jgi:uncharacterized membrane protein
VARVDKTIEVNVPLGTAFSQWTAFEDFPHFMEGVEQVRRLDDDLLSWVTTLGGERHESQVRIVRRVPNKVLAWESESEDGNNGTVVFRAVGTEKTEVQLHLDYAADNVRDQLGDSRGVVSRRIDGNLSRFKDFVEAKVKKVKTRP